MPTELSKARSPSPGSYRQILCIDDQSVGCSKHHRQSPIPNRTYSISRRPPPERLGVVAQAGLVPQWRRRHESTNRAGHQWDRPGDDNSSDRICVATRAHMAPVIHCSSFCLGAAPTWRDAISPFLNSIRVGIDMTPHLEAVSGCSSTLSLTILTLPSSEPLISSSAGAIIR